MILCETHIRYKDSKTKKAGIRHLAVPEESEYPQRDWTRLIHDLNNCLGNKFDPDNKISAYICDAKEGDLDVIIAYPINDVSLDYCYDSIRRVIEDNYAVCDLTFGESTEISGKKFDFLGNKADENGYIKRWCTERANLGIDYFRNCHFSVEEYLVDKNYSTLAEAEEAADMIMADASFTEELNRIYSDENQKKYFGNPVHYKITASCSKASLDMVNILVPALIANKRLCGRRIIRIFNISEGCYDEEDFEHLIKSSQGNTVIIDMSGTNEDHGNYASAYLRVIEYFDSIINKYHLNTLCIFVELLEHPGFSNSLIAKVREELHIVSMNEGYGNVEQAKSYLRKLSDSEVFDITDDELNSALKDKKMFSVGDIYSIHNAWFKNGLRTHVYKAYMRYEYTDDQSDEPINSPYEELRKMIGLNEIKHIVDEIIDTGRINKLRSSMGLDTSKTSLHMVFTGNPGSAKTTVARLIAQILRKEDLIDGGTFVECGRADLIAKYVGWTAKQVRTKFREAKGGILFIDEAYSLVDDSHSFADEAINTIVQEMENQRENVIVIFAGYPDKMKEFLNKNEGLRSRIAFHLDFPDYTPDEMKKILSLMADKQGYKIDSRAMNKCNEIFTRACSEKDFGNGRFARNLIEQARMAQSHRLSSEYKGKKISKKALTTLTAEDFDVNITNKLKTSHVPIGFAV